MTKGGPFLRTAPKASKQWLDVLAVPPQASNTTDPYPCYCSEQETLPANHRGISSIGKGTGVGVLNFSGK